MTIARTELGAVEGLERNGVAQFRGIRFGAPTSGSRRFRAPEAAGGWTGTYDATRFGSAAPQPPETFSGPPEGSTDEDCLFLNVYTPAPDDAARPVMVWFHGGGNTSGSPNLFDASQLVRQGDVVVVCVTYRLGFLGFADLRVLGADFRGSAVNGFRDQTLALRWVQEHIAAFGGDPGQVTIFGQSAGAGGVLAQLASPDAQGLFHRAIACSPGGMNNPATDTLGRIARTMQLEPVEAANALLDLSVEELLDVQTRSGYSLGGGYDGEVIPTDVVTATRSRGGDGVPLLIGTARDEGTLFEQWTPADPDVKRAVRRSVAVAATLGAPVDGYLQRLEQAYPDADDLALNLRVWGDRYRRVSVELAATATDVGPGAWLYRFDFPTTIADGALGATHAGDVPFVFNAFAGGNAHRLAMHDPEDPAAVELARRWSDTLIRFARTGDPNGGDLPAWPRYEARERASLRVDAECEIVRDIDHPHRLLWEDA